MVIFSQCVPVSNHHTTHLEFKHVICQLNLNKAGEGGEKHKLSLFTGGRVRVQTQGQPSNIYKNYKGIWPFISSTTSEFIPSLYTCTQEKCQMYKVVHCNTVTIMKKTETSQQRTG